MRSRTRKANLKRARYHTRRRRYLRRQQSGGLFTPKQSLYNLNNPKLQLLTGPLPDFLPDVVRKETYEYVLEGYDDLTRMNKINKLDVVWKLLFHITNTDISQIQRLINIVKGKQLLNQNNKNSIIQELEKIILIMKTLTVNAYKYNIIFDSFIVPKYRDYIDNMLEQEPPHSITEQPDENLLLEKLRNRNPFEIKYNDFYDTIVQLRNQAYEISGYPQCTQSEYRPVNY